MCTGTLICSYQNDLNLIIDFFSSLRKVITFFSWISKKPDISTLNHKSPKRSRREGVLPKALNTFCR